MAKKYLNFVFAALFAIFSISQPVLFATNVYADDDSTEQSSETEEEDMIHLQVEPGKKSLYDLTPGASYVDYFTVRNVGALEFNYEVYATPYSVNNDEYDVNYEATDSAYNKLSEWVTFDKKTKTGTLQPQEAVKVYFTINVPSDAAGGAQYAAIMVQTADGNDENATIQTINRIGMELYGEVDGETYTGGEIISNNIPVFLFNPPLTVTSLVSNSGNVESQAEYILKIWPLFSKETIYNNEEQPGSLAIIPGTRRFSSSSWDGAPKLGIFWVEQTINYLGETSVNHKLVIICPLWLLFIILAIIFLLIFRTVAKIRENKKNNKVIE